MTNQQAIGKAMLSIYSAEDTYLLMNWLLHDYGKQFASSEAGVKEWLQETCIDPDRYRNPLSLYTPTVECTGDSCPIRYDS